MIALLAMLAPRIIFIGAGRMASALARALVRAEILPPSSITATDTSAEAREAFSGAVPGAAVLADNVLAVADADVVVLAVKPQTMPQVLAEISGPIRLQTLIVSIAAGVTLERLSAGLPEGQRIVRVMPNTPCLIGKGVSGLSLGRYATSEDGQLVQTLLSAVGGAHEVPEAWLDAVTGLSGSGPAFVYSMIEALAAGGVEAGLPYELSLELASRTVSGAAEMVLQTGEAPSELRERVKSPGGTTVAGLAVLDARGFAKTVAEAVVAAARRSAELGQATN